MGMLLLLLVPLLFLLYTLLLFPCFLSICVCTLGFTYLDPRVEEGGKAIYHFFELNNDFDFLYGEKRITRYIVRGCS